MKKHSLKVALNMSSISVPDKINKARHITDAINSNTTVFASPSPAIITVTNAIDDLEIAWNNAADGGKSKTAIMHDKESLLMKLMNDLAHYVEGIADGDEATVHLAAMDTKKKPQVKNPPEFEVYQWDAHGAVGVRAKARVKTIYKWLYCKAPLASNAWTTASTTDISRSMISGLDAGSLYYFKVIFVSASGETPSAEISFAVN